MANRWVALAIVFVTRTSMGYQFQSVASVGPLLVSELGLTWAQLGLLIGLYMLPGAFFALPSGVVGQRLGVRRTVVGSLALMVVRGLVTAASHRLTVAHGRRRGRGAAGAPRGARGARGRARGERGPRVGLLQREPRRCRRVRPRDADGPRPLARRRRLRREPGDLGDDPFGAPRRAPHRPPPPAEP